MVQGWESNVNRKGDMEKLMKYKKVVSTFMLKIHKGGKLGNSVPKIEEKNIFKPFSFASFHPSNRNYFPQMDGCVQYNKYKSPLY